MPQSLRFDGFLRSCNRQSAKVHGFFASLRPTIDPQQPRLKPASQVYVPSSFLSGVLQFFPPAVPCPFPPECYRRRLQHAELASTTQPQRNVIRTANVIVTARQLGLASVASEWLLISLLSLECGCAHERDSGKGDECEIEAHIGVWTVGIVDQKM